MPAYLWLRFLLPHKTEPGMQMHNTTGTVLSTNAVAKDCITATQRLPAAMRVNVEAMACWDLVCERCKLTLIVRPGLGVDTCRARSEKFIPRLIHASEPRMFLYFFRPFTPILTGESRG